MRPTNPATSPAQYDAVGERYLQFKRSHNPLPEQHTVRRLLGNVSGADVLDLACGYGHYTRLVKQLGAKTAVGVDISAEMVALARRIEQDEPTGAAYHVHDVASMPVLGTFQAATAVWLFNYADSPDQLASMFTALHANLLPGGRLVAITIGPDYDPSGPSWEPYGLRVVDAAPGFRHTELAMDILSTPPTRLRYRRWDRDVYEEAATSAGLAAPVWHPAEIPADAIARKGEAYWQPYRANPFLAAFDTYRPRT
ncbi:class I SAM-dependent methyltransferase [Streptomyces apocyni]|uniref:class I SAM-dependent methyltransferase n=1 Tax=Streptomyces apocyni TaxID=2654677 RepID=UPI0012E992FD|nr:class I SAM-dependent methyltransferase [Streptomyces apocyni]